MTVQMLPSGKFRYKIGTLPRSNEAHVHYQGGSFIYQDKIGILFGRGATPETTQLMFSFSHDGGLTWEEPVRESNLQNENNLKLIPYAQSFTPHWNVVEDNRLFVMIKGHAEINNQGVYALYSKLIKRYEVRYTEIKTTNGSPVVEILWPKHGLKGGSKSDTVRISKFQDYPTGTQFNGISENNLNVERGVTVVDRDRFRISVGKNAEGTGVKLMFIGVTFTPWGWTEELYPHASTGQLVPWETALLSRGIVPPTGAVPLDNANISQGAYKLGDGRWAAPMAGNYKGVMTVPSPINGTASQWSFGEPLRRCTGDGPGTEKYLSEPTLGVDRDANGNPTNTVFGFLRTQGKPGEFAPEFFWSPDGGLTIGADRQKPISDNIAARCPIPCALGDDGYIYGFTTDRLTAHTGDARVQGAYLLRAKKTDALAVGSGKGGPAFQIYKVGQVLCLSQAENLPPAPTGPGRSSEAGNTGLPTCVKHGSWIVFFYEEQELGAFQNSAGSATVENNWCNVKYFAIDTAPRTADDASYLYDMPLTRYGMLG